MRLLKKLGDFLDTADATETDLQSLTRQVSVALEAKKASAVENAKQFTLDLGISEGFSDLKAQLGELKDTTLEYLQLSKSERKLFDAFGRISEPISREEALYVDSYKGK